MYVSSLLGLQVQITLVVHALFRGLDETRRVFRVPFLPRLRAEPDVVRVRKPRADPHERAVSEGGSGEPTGVCRMYAQRFIIIRRPAVVEDGADERGHAAGAPTGAVVAGNDEHVDRFAHVVLHAPQSHLRAT